MARMNSKMNLPQLQKIMMDFEREVSRDLIVTVSVCACACARVCMYVCKSEQAKSF